TAAAVEFGSGAAQNFASLLAARLGVGLGEAGAGPPAHALAADLYPFEERGGAAAVLVAATFVGALVGTSLGGYLATAYGWRVAFFVLGGAGLALLPLAMSLSEPRAGGRRASLKELFGRAARETVVRLLARRSFALLVAGMSFYAVFAQSLAMFGVAFLMRSFEMTEADVGLQWGVTLATASLFGVVVSARVVNALSAERPAWLCLLPALVVAAAAVAFGAALSSGVVTWVFGFAWFGLALIAAGGPAAFAAVYAVSRADERSQAIAVMLFVSNLVGLFFGPVAGGAISDALAASGLGAESLRVTLLIMVAALPAAAAAFAGAGAFFEADRRAVGNA
ncbi:MAG: MFS transporter, partial [Caulobacterales bacterium]|nr:MFS transporter [Caulobacterales bacterium]